MLHCQSQKAAGREEIFLSGPFFVPCLEDSHKGTNAQRNTKGLIIKKTLAPWCAASCWQKFSWSTGEGPRSRQKTGVNLKEMSFDPMKIVLGKILLILYIMEIPLKLLEI
jgi:hypothetical protein